MTSFDGPVSLEQARANLIVIDAWGWLAWRWAPHENACRLVGNSVRLRWMFGPGFASSYVCGASKMVWYINTGRWPSRVKYRNGNSANIRFANLYVVGEPDVSDLV